MYTGLSLDEAIALLNSKGVTNHKITALVNNKQQFCDKEVVVCVRECVSGGLPCAEIITTLLRSNIGRDGADE